MGTVVEKLQKALENKEEIKRALLERGQNIGNAMNTYPLAIRNIKDEFTELFIKFLEDSTTEFKFPYGTKTIKSNFYNGLTIKTWWFPSTLQEIKTQSINLNLYNASQKYLDFYYNGSFEDWIKIPKGEYSTSMRIPYGYSSYSGTHHLLHPNNSADYFTGDIIIPDGTETIPRCACVFLMTNKDRKIINSIIRIPSSVKVIEDGAFSYMNGIKNIIFENTTDFIELGEGIFYSLNMKYSDDENLPQYYIEELVMPKIKKLSSMGKTGFKKLILQEGLEEIGDYGLNSTAFYDDGSGNFDLIFPTTLTKIGTSGLQIQNSRGGSYKFKNLVIPETITDLGKSLTNRFDTITFLSATPCTITSSTFTTFTGFKIYVPKGCSNTYKTATNWSKYATFIFEEYVVNFTIPSLLINNENVTYSLDNGKTYNKFNNIYMSLDEVATIRIKSTDSSQTILIGTTEGGSDVGTISNSELTFSFTTDTNVYLTIQ